MKYVTSDLHLDHANIIEYCDRPFDDVDEMNEHLVDEWNSTVSEGDVVYYLGDLAMWGSDAAEKWAGKLNGELLFVEGNHDDIDESTFPHPVVDSCVFTHGKYRFGCVHWPEESENPGGDWLLYGHHHNNDVYEYPFVDYRENRVNVSVELTDYRPLSLDELTSILDRKERFETLSATSRRD